MLSDEREEKRERQRYATCQLQPPRHVTRTEYKYNLAQLFWASDPMRVLGQSQPSTVPLTQCAVHRHSSQPQYAGPNPPPGSHIVTSEQRPPQRFLPLAKRRDFSRGRPNREAAMCYDLMGRPGGTEKRATISFKMQPWRNSVWTSQSRTRRKVTICNGVMRAKRLSFVQRELNK